MPLTLFGIATGTVAGGAALWLGLRHNAQAEFFDPATGQIDVGYCAMVFGVWFVLGAAAAVLLAGLIRGLVGVIGRGA